MQKVLLINIMKTNHWKIITKNQKSNNDDNRWSRPITQMHDFEERVIRANDHTAWQSTWYSVCVSEHISDDLMGIIEKTPSSNSALYGNLMLKNVGFTARYSHVVSDTMADFYQKP